MTELNPELEAVADALDEAYTKDELLAYADDFGVEVKSHMRKDAITRAYAEDGITVELIKGLTPDAEVEDDEKPVVADAPAPVAEEEEGDDLVLIKMVRPNHSYEARGYRFNRLHPFALVTEEAADYLIEVEGGFVVASPKEAKAYYS